MKCFGCGIEKDMSVLERYPYSDDARLWDGPLEPLFVLEVEPTEKHGDWKVAVVCHACYKRLDPDLWISENCWIGINPVIPFEKLPLNNLPTETDAQRGAKWSPGSYATVADQL